MAACSLFCCFFIFAEFEINEHPNMFFKGKGGENEIILMNWAV